MKTILVVEDEGLIAMDLKRRLERFGYAVPSVAATADDAVELASSQLPALVLMDIRLQGKKDGIEAAADVRKLDIPVIFLTAHTDANTIERASLTKPYGYIAKPFGSTDIKAQIEIAICRHRSDRQLRRSDAWLDATLRSVGDAVIGVDLGGNVELMNPAAERLSGRRFGDVRGMPAGQLFGGSTAWKRSESLASLDGNPDCPIGTVIAFRETGPGHGGRDAAAVMAGLLAGHFHHLRTVFEASALNRQSALQLTELVRTCDEADEALQAATLAAEFGRRLFAAGGKGVAQNQVFELNRAIRQSAKMLRQLMPGASRKLDLKLHRTQLLVCADPLDIQRVLIHLTMDSGDAMRQGGRVTIGTAVCASGAVELSVEDAGMGMASEMRQRIFAPIAGEKMTSVHSIVTRAGGTIEVDREVDRDVDREGAAGTRIRILLPTGLSAGWPAGDFPGGKLQ